MKNNILLRTNLLIGVVIAIGFMMDSMIGCRFNFGIFSVGLLVIVIVTTIVRRYNARISGLIVSQELEYQRLLHEMTQGLYENIFELDITHNCAGGEGTRRYFKSLGLDADASYDRARKMVAEKQIKQEYVQQYLHIFSPEAVMAAYNNGITNLSYDFMISENGAEHHWVRISARIFYWNSDKSIRMITYRTNIDAEKKRELMLLENIQRDSMTGLYNKRTTEEMISHILQLDAEADSCRHAFLIFDIDNFKMVNDNMGHSFGDHVINEIAAELKTQFREDDILGRIGGDEFAVLMKNIDDMEWLKQKLTRLCGKIGKKNFGERDGLVISCSIGVALFSMHGVRYSELYEKADQALYYAKNHGKNSFVIFGESIECHSFHINQRDLETLMNVAADGLAQYACTDPLTLLYFNPKCVELFGIPTAVLSAPGYNPLSQVHPDDAEKINAVLKFTIRDRKPFTREFRVWHQDGHYFWVKVQGVFISDLYKNRYPIFYVMYTKLEQS